LKINDLPAVQTLMQQNHRLLYHIGVVPEKVNQFIKDIEQVGGGAKICGAGATRGHQAGFVLVLFENTDQIKKICHDYHYFPEAIAIESQGKRIVS